MTGGGRPRRVLLALALLTAAALALRATGIRTMLPHLQEPDGGKVAYQLDRIEGRVPADEEHPFWGFYPHLTARLASAWPGCVPGAGERPPYDREQHLARAGSTYLRLRETVAIAGVLAVPGTYLLARLFLGPGWSMLAAAFLAASFLHTWFSQQARPHALAATTMLWAVLAAVHLRRRPTLPSFLLAGLAAGLAVASLQSGLAVLFPLAAAAFLRERDERSRSAWWLAAALILAALVARAFYPSMPPGPPGPPGEAETAIQAPLVDWDGERGVLTLSGHIVMIGLFDGSGFATVARTLWSYETWIATLALLGALAALGMLAAGNARPSRSVARDLIVVVAFAVPYLIVIGLYARTYQRFVLPLLPCACVLAAALFQILSQLAARARAPRLPRTAVRVVALAFLALQVASVVRLVAVRSAEDTGTRAGRWLAEHAPQDARIAIMPGIDVPLVRTADARRVSARTLTPRGYPWIDYQNALPEAELPPPRFELFTMPLGDQASRDKVGADAVQYVLGLGADYVVVEAYHDYWRAGVLKTLYDAATMRGELVARFSPDGPRPNAGMPLTYQDDEQPIESHWLTRTLQAECTGPVIEIYRLARENRAR